MGCGSSKQQAYEDGYAAAAAHGQQPPMTYSGAQQPPMNYAGPAPYPQKKQPGRKSKAATRLGFLSVLAN